MIPAIAAAMTGLPTITISHLAIKVFFGMYGFRSSVPGIVQALV